MLKKWLSGIVTPIIIEIISNMTPDLRLTLTKFVHEFYKKAKQTDNPWDDLLAGVALILLGEKNG